MANTIHDATALASLAPAKTVTNAVPADIVLIHTDTEARIDSRLLAQGFGNRHKSVMNLIDRYADSFKTHGQLTFKKSVGKREHGGGNAERYALLNEDQVYFLLTLSRNSETVVSLKSKLVKAFSTARRAADLRKTEYLPGYHGLHNVFQTLASGSTHASRVHQNVNKLLNKFVGIGAGQRTTAEPPKQALMIIALQEATQAAQNATDHRDGYQRIKHRLNTLQRLLLGSEPS
mgnify:CR=1 FL=1